jgi:hypothetical protein
MLDGIVMNVVKLALEILFVTDQMIPKAWLPKLQRILDTQVLLVPLGEIALQRMDNAAKVALPCGPDQNVKMFGQERVAEHDERMKVLDLVQRGPQQRNLGRVMKDRLALCDYLCDEYDRVRRVIPAQGGRGRDSCSSGSKVGRRLRK